MPCNVDGHARVVAGVDERLLIVPTSSGIFMWDLGHDPLALGYESSSDFMGD